MTFSPLGKFGLACLLTVIAASNSIAIKYALNLGWPHFLLGLLRMGFVCFAFILWLRFRDGRLFSTNAQANRYALIASLFKGLAVTAFYWSLSLIDASRFVMIATISPIVGLVLVHFLHNHEQVRKHHLLGILVSLFGVVGLLQLQNGAGNVGASSSALHIGDLAAIVSVICMQTLVIFEKKSLLAGITPRQLSLTTNLISIPIFFVFVLATGEKMSDIPPTLPSFLVFLYLITIVGVFFFYYRRWLLQYIEVTYVNSFSHLNKALAIVFAVVLLGETISLAALICFAFVLTGSIIASHAPDLKKLTRRQLVRSS